MGAKVTQTPDSCRPNLYSTTPIDFFNGHAALDGTKAPVRGTMIGLNEIIMSLKN